MHDLLMEIMTAIWPSICQWHEMTEDWHLLSAPGYGVMNAIYWKRFHYRLSIPQAEKARGILYDWKVKSHVHFVGVIEIALPSSKASGLENELRTKFHHVMEHPVYARDTDPSSRKGHNLFIKRFFVPPEIEREPLIPFFRIWYREAGYTFQKRMDLTSFWGSRTTGIAGKNHCH